MVGCGSSGGGSSGGSGGGGGGTGSSNDITGFSFPGGVIKSTTIDENTNSIDVTIDYNSNELKPTVNHNGADYSPTEAIDFTKVTIPIEYNITAANGDVKSYTVTVRRGFVVSTEEGLVSAIDNVTRDINDKSSSTKYITILITKDINLTNKITLPANWAGRNIIFENNSSASTVNIRGLESNGTVELTGVRGEVIIKAIAAGYGHSLAIDSDGKLWATGNNEYGQLGLGYFGDRNEFDEQVNHTSFQPVTIPALPLNAKIVSIAASWSHSLALDSEGRLWAAGSNNAGQSGLGDTTDRNSFQPVIFTGLSPNAKIVSIAAGEAHSLALDSEGRLWVTGANNAGQLGLNYPNDYPTSFQAININSSLTFISISAGGAHSLALDNNSKLWTTGRSISGQLGLGDNKNRYLFTSVSSILSPNITSIAAGFSHSLALTGDGKLWVTGSNSNGALGLVDSNNRNSFQSITFTDVKFNSVVAGNDNSFAIDSNGKLWATGYNFYGQLGLGSSSYGADRSLFQEVKLGLISNANITSISAGYGYSLALDSDGKVWASGVNGAGQLGLGDDVPRDIFTQVSF